MPEGDPPGETRPATVTDITGPWVLEGMGCFTKVL